MTKEGRTGTLLYPQHLLKPEDFLVFWELDEFSQDWSDLGFDVDNDMWALMASIMANPNGAPVIKGTGGLRKLRFAAVSENRGKRGAARVCYAYFPSHWTVLLVMAYGKKDKDNLDDAEKKAIKEYLAVTQTWLDERNY